MQSAGVWDNTTVLLSSDHPWRRSSIFDDKKDNRVPFIVKIAGHSESVRYEGAFNNVVSHDLLLNVLDGKISDPTSLANWLQEPASAQRDSEGPRIQVRGQTNKP